MLNSDNAIQIAQIQQLLPSQDFCPKKHWGGGGKVISKEPNVGQFQEKTHRE
jgi:hypothetical protein